MINSEIDEEHSLKLKNKGQKDMKRCADRENQWYVFVLRGLRYL